MIHSSTRLLQLRGYHAPVTPWQTSRRIISFIWRVNMVDPSHEKPIANLEEWFLLLLQTPEMNGMPGKDPDVLPEAECQEHWYWKGRYD